MLLAATALVVLAAAPAESSAYRAPQEPASQAAAAPAAQTPGPPPSTSPATVRPKARAQDVVSIEAIVAAVYDVISGPAGPRDWDRFTSLLLPDCRLVPVSHASDGQDVYRMLDSDAYIQRAQVVFSKQGFFETGIANRIERFGSIAHVFSTYESRHEKDGAPFARGINSFQLVKLGDRWWVASILWDTERPGVPIPEKYLGR